jgi:hypothetical protein
MRMTNMRIIRQFNILPFNFPRMCHVPSFPYSSFPYSSFIHPSFIFSRTFFGSFALTNSYDCLTYFSHSFLLKRLCSKTVTHCRRAKCDAWMISPVCVSSSNCSSGILIATCMGGSSPVRQNIFPATEKTRWFSHLMSSVVAGRLKQNSRSSSMFICQKY